jgi:hypothetical protein
VVRRSPMGGVPARDVRKGTRRCYLSCGAYCCGERLQARACWPQRLSAGIIERACPSTPSGSRALSVGAVGFGFAAHHARDCVLAHAPDLEALELQGDTIANDQVEAIAAVKVHALPRAVVSDSPSVPSPNLPLFRPSGAIPVWSGSPLAARSLVDVNVRIENQHSIGLSQDACFGVKWRVQSGCSSNHSFTSGVSWAERLSDDVATTWWATAVRSARERAAERRLAPPAKKFGRRLIAEANATA